MRFHHAVVATLAVCALPATQAFTQGALLLPSYLCGPAIANADGTISGAEKPVAKPKALGGVLQNLVEYTYANSREVADGNDFFYDPINDPMIFLGAMHNAFAAKMSKQLHPANATERFPGPVNPLNEIAPVRVPYNNKTIPIKAQTNVLNVLRIPAIPAPVGVGAEQVPGNQVAPPAATTTNVITPNQVVILTLQAKNDILGGLPANNVFDPANGADNALDGAVVYAQNAKNARVGKFPSGGEAAEPWAACGPDNNGIVHNQLLSGTNVYNGPTFFLPFDYAWPVKSGGVAPGISTITMMGAAVSDGGFGYHQTKWQVQPLPDLPINILALNAQDRMSQCKVDIVPNKNKQPPTVKLLDPNFRACITPCMDCLKQAGSTTNKAVGNKVTATCTPNLDNGNPAMNQTTTWSFECKIAGKVTPVVPVGTFWVQPPAAKDANGNDMPMSEEDQATLDAFAAALAPPAPDAPPTCTNTNQQNSNVNTATTTPHQGWITTLAIALSAVFAARR